MLLSRVRPNDLAALEEGRVLRPEGEGFGIPSRSRHPLARQVDCRERARERERKREREKEREKDRDARRSKRGMRRVTGKLTVAEGQRDRTTERQTDS